MTVRLGALPRADPRDGDRLRRAHSLNTYRNVGAMLGAFAAVAHASRRRRVRRRRRRLAAAGGLVGRVVAAAVAGDLGGHLGAARLPGARGGWASSRACGSLARHAPSASSWGCYLCGRIADGPDRRDVPALLHATGSAASSDFEPTMALFLVAGARGAADLAARRAARREGAPCSIGALWWAAALADHPLRRARLAALDRCSALAVLRRDRLRRGGPDAVVDARRGGRRGRARDRRAARGHLLRPLHVRAQARRRGRGVGSR